MLSRQLIVWRGSRVMARRETGFVRIGHPERVSELALKIGGELGLGQLGIAARCR